MQPTPFTAFALTALFFHFGNAGVLPGGAGWESGFDADAALGHIRVLTSDSLRGRYSGFPGAEKADRYITSHFERLGLEKTYRADGYAHRFTYGAGDYQMPCGLKARYPDGSTDTANFWRDLNVFKYSGFGKVTGRLVLVGYGISAPEEGWDDYAGLDVCGAIVLAWRGTPPLPSKYFGDWGASGRKSSFARERGAAGFIYCDDDPPKWATIMEKFFRDNLPAVWISQSFADRLLKGTGRSKDELKRLADSTLTPVSRALDVTVELQVSGSYYPELPTQNLAALLPGSDANLRKEIVVIGAHMDHHGVDPAGNLYPGADDNASGTAVMMELARVFSEQTVRPKRSLMFIGFAAEEEGLVGSRAFVKDMRLPDGMKVVAMLNMDMVGQGNCSLGVAGINEFPILGEALFADWPDSALNALEFWGLFPGSDHASFQQEGIPAYVVGARGDHPNYHTPGDSAGNIKPEVLKAVGDMMFHCANALLEYPAPLAPLVNKAEWLVRANGGVKEHGLALADVGWTKDKGGVGAVHNRQAREALLRPPTDRVRGVDYPVPLTLFTLNEPTPSHRRDRIDVKSFLQGMQLARGWAAAQDLPFLADSARKDYKGEPYRGVTVALNYLDLPADSLLVKIFAREGVGFVTGIYAPFDDRLRLDDWYAEATGTHIPGWRAIARNCRMTGIGVWLKANNTISDQPIERFPAEFSELWDGRVVCDFSGRHLPRQPGLEKLLDGGWFLILRDTETILNHRGTPYWRRIGIPSDTTVVNELLKAGVENEEIGQLLLDNLVRWLARRR